MQSLFKTLFITSLFAALAACAPVEPTTYGGQVLSSGNSATSWRNAVIGNTIVLSDGGYEYHSPNGYTIYQRGRNGAPIRGDWWHAANERICYQYVEVGPKQHCWKLRQFVPGSLDEALLHRSPNFRANYVQYNGDAEVAGKIMNGDYYNLEQAWTASRSPYPTVAPKW